MEDIFDKTLTWFNAEGSRGNKPCLYRGREIPKELVATPALPFLFVISYSFDVADSTGLPTRQQYEDIGKFERDFIDTIESCHFGILSFVKTFDGVIRYFVYVSNVDIVSTQLADAGSAYDAVRFVATEEPDWGEYRAFLAGMKHG